MTAFATQSNIDMNGPGLLGSDVAGSSRRKSKRITIGTGLTLSGGVLSNSLDLSGYVQKTSSTGSLILPSGTTAERDGSPAAGYSRWNTTTSRFERWTGSVWENYVRLSGDTMSGSLTIGDYPNVLRLGTAGSYRGEWYTNGGTVGLDVYSATDVRFWVNSDALWLKSGEAIIPGGSLAFASGFGSTRDIVIKRAAAGVLADRNGINAQCFLLNKTYTSDATQEALMLDAGKQISGKLGLYSYRGSIGGSNYPIQIGMLAADGTTFTGMTVPVTGPVSLSRDLVMNGAYPYFGLVASSWSGGTFYFQAGVDSAGTGTGNFTGLLNPLGKSFAVVSGNPNTTGRLHLTIDGTTSSAVFAGQITLSASTTAVASLNLPSGTAPTSPANGDIWSDGSDIKVRLGGVTYTLSKV